MIYLPFIYFGVLMLTNIRKNGIFNIGTYIVALYALISFMSIVLAQGGYYDWSVRDYPIQPYAPILYVILLSACIFPYLKKLPRLSPYLSRRGEKLLDILTVGYFVIFCIVLVVSLTRIQEIMTSNALAEIRNEQYTGDAVAFYDHLHGIPRYVCAMCQILAPSANVMTLLTMYSIAFRKKSVLYNLMGITGSMTMLLIAVNIADRSNFVYWMLFMGLALFIFFPYLSRGKRIGVSAVVAAVLGLILVYFMAVTNDRFEDRADGAEGGLISYAGQSFINFCNFIEYVRPAYSLCEIFPLITMLTGGPGYFEVADTVQSDVSLYIPVFSTFLGYIYSISGGVVMILFVVLYNRISVWLFRKVRKSITLGGLLRIWAGSLVLVLGLFGYYYSFANCTIALIIWIWLSFMLEPGRNSGKTVSRQKVCQRQTTE
jgi:hypothetical protein